MDSTFPPKANPKPVEAGGAGAGDEAVEFPNENFGFGDVLLPPDADVDPNENSEVAGPLVEEGKSGLLDMLDAAIEGLADVLVVPPKPPNVGVVAVLVFAVVVALEDWFEPFI